MGRPRGRGLQKIPARASGREIRSGRHIEREDRDGVADAEDGDGDGDGAFAELREGAGRAALVGRDAYDVRVAAAPLNVPRGVDGGREYGHADGLRIAGPVIFGVHGELAVQLVHALPRDVDGHAVDLRRGRLDRRLGYDGLRLRRRSHARNGGRVDRAGRGGAVEADADEHDDGEDDRQQEDAAEDKLPAGIARGALPRRGGGIRPGARGRHAVALLDAAGAAIGAAAPKSGVLPAAAAAGNTWNETHKSPSIHGKSKVCA